MIKERIAAYVEEKGLKQIYISQRTGLSPQAVSSLLRGERNLDVEEYAKLCDVLGVPYNYFFDGCQKAS